ncbi:MAG: ADP-ribosylglycohydrolase family protein [Planctomycetaceae bacterium]|nr:ADP-ribosylglycohydrolase family protein [Planctomycetaceae bacterium]
MHRLAGTSRGSQNYQAGGSLRIRLARLQGRTVHPLCGVDFGSSGGRASIHESPALTYLTQSGFKDLRSQSHENLGEFPHTPEISQILRPTTDTRCECARIIKGEFMAPTFSTVAGCLIGCAVGDAMGAPFEGLWSESIPSADLLLAGFHEYHGYPRGQYTDDTQLTLATIESVVARRVIHIPDIARRIAELWRHYSVIGPGGACTAAAERFLATGSHIQMGAAVGQAGNGAAMRTASLGLWFGDNHDAVISAVTEVSQLTHRDSRSIAGGVVIAMAAGALARNRKLNAEAFCAYLADSCRQINPELADLLVQLPLHFESNSAIDFIAHSGQEKPEFDRPIITPFVVPTVLAAIYCLIVHPNSWSDAVTTAIRLGGDVDTLGAIVGAVAGARDGIESIPRHLVETVQNSRSILTLATKYYHVLGDWHNTGEFGGNASQRT